MYKIRDRMTTPIMIIETKGEDVHGRTKFVETENTEMAWCVWKSYGGTEKQTGSQTGGISGTSFPIFEDTATIQLRYTPNLKENYYIRNLQTNVLYRVITIPDNINQMNQFLIVKVKRVV